MGAAGDMLTAALLELIPEPEQFVEQCHGGSFVRMMDALYRDKKLSESDIDELLQWLKTKY